MPHLLGKWAIGAVGCIAEAKVFINLQQALLTNDRAQELFLSRIVGEQARGRDFDRAVGKLRPQFLVVAPEIAIVCERERIDDIGQDFGGTGISDEREGGSRALCRERVMRGPEIVLQTGQ